MKIKLLLSFLVLFGGLFFVFRASDVNAAAITSAQSGNWSSTSTWTGGVVPGTGDTVTIGGAHTITITSPVTVGDGTTTYAISMSNSSAVLNVRANLTLRASGVRVTNGQFKVDAVTPAAPITITLAAEGTNNSIVWESGNTTGRVIEFIGDASNKVTITDTTTGVGGIGRFLSTASTAGQTTVWTFRHVVIDGLGSTGSVSSFSNVPEIDMEDVLIKNSGRVNIIANGDFTFKMNRVDFRGFLDAPIVYNNPASKGTKDRFMTNTTWSSSTVATGYLQAPDLTVTNLVSNNAALFSYQNANDGKRQRWSNIFFISNSGWSDELLTVPPGGDNRFDNVVFSRYFTSSVNAHTIKDITGASLGIGPNQLTNSFIDAWGNGNASVGDTVLNNGDWIIDYNIAIGQYGNLFDGFHGNSGTMKARHNTLLTANNLGSQSSHNQGSMVLAEAYGSATKISEIKGNLFTDNWQGVTMGYNSGFPSYQWVPQTSMVLDYNGAYNMLDPQNFLVPGTSTRSYLFQPEGNVVYYRPLGASTATTGTSQNTLVISGANFISSGVIPGDVVYKGSGFSSKAALVQSVDSQTQLTLGASINTAATNGIVGLASGDTINIHAGYWADGGKYGDDGKGLHDVYANPSFYDGTRSTSTWSTSLGGDGTALSVIQEMLKLNGYDINGTATTYNSNYSTTNLLSYIRAGYAPTNSAFKAASYDGLDIGAVSVVDVVAPTVSITTPANSSTVSGNTTVTASASDAFGVVGVQFKLDGSNLQSEDTVAPYTISWDTTTASAGTHTLTAVARDAAGNSTTSSSITVTVSNDSTPPIRSAGSPATALTAGTTSTTLSLTTNENATCKYGTTSGVPYASMSSTFSTTGTTSHSQNITGLSNGTSYTYYVRCVDTGSNANTDDYSISFSVAAPSSGGSSYRVPVISSILITNIKETEATITWVTDIDSKGAVSLGNTYPYVYTSSKEETSYTTNHSITLNNLNPNTTYHYQVGSTYIYGGSSVNPNATFQTLSTPSTTPTTPTTPAPSSLVIRLVNDNGTFYLIQDGARRGVPNSGILFSHGLEFKDATLATEQDKSLPQGPFLLPGDGALVKSPENPTVYLISNSKKYGFTSGTVFTGLGFSFKNVLVVTTPELNLLSLGEVLFKVEAHKQGTNILHQGTIYWVGGVKRHPYPSLEVYNSWNKDNDFSTVVPANSEDLKMEVGESVIRRVF
jgi:hypothetical protein